jgi:hypothetical protein
VIIHRQYNIALIGHERSPFDAERLYEESNEGLLSDVTDASALSHDDFRVDRLQLSPRVADLELPVDAALSGVAVGMPGDGFRAQQVNGREATAADALPRHGA